VTRPGSPAWWAGKVRQARRYAGGRVDPAERADLARWVTPPQLEAFEAMHRADQRHGLDVVAWLRAHDEHDDEVLLAGLLHDAGKGDTGFAPRVVYSLSQAYGDWILSLATIWPPLARSLARLKVHPERSAEVAKAAGCSPRTLELILQQDVEPADDTARRFHLADEAS
jgi:hypothetical protein